MVFAAGSLLAMLHCIAFPNVIYSNGLVYFETTYVRNDAVVTFVTMWHEVLPSVLAPGYRPRSIRCPRDRVFEQRSVIDIVKEAWTS